VGDEAGFIRLLHGRLAIQDKLLKCLGLDSSPLRYMTNYWVRKIGHLGQIEFYIKPLILGLLGPSRPVILCSDAGEIANRCLLDYWRQYIEVVIDSGIAEERSVETGLLNLDIHLFEGGQEPIYHKEAAAIAYERWTKEARGPLFSLTADHRERGRRALERAGFPPGAWFVALHVREPGFSNDPGPAQRNAAIDSYLPAIREVIARGGWVIRLGDAKMKPLANIPALFDYCQTDVKSDWMDIFLMAECRFFVGVASGPAQVPPLFGVPCVYTNWSPLGDYPFHENGLLIHKKHLDKATGAEVAYSRFARLSSDYGDNIDRLGLVLKDNTPEEIRDVVGEMLDRLEGMQPSCPENARRQARFLELAAIERAIGRPTLGCKFLEQNAALLS
jgi:putative glycosyltransferase (TIGR04372 family)